MTHFDRTWPVTLGQTLIFFGLQSGQLTHVNIFYFDLTCDVSSDPEVNEIRFLYTFSGTIESRFNFENRTSSFGDSSWLKIAPPPPVKLCDGKYPNEARDKLR